MKEYLLTTKSIMLTMLAGMSLFPISAKALDCTATPDCKALGYTMSTADCADSPTVKCPTDTSKVFCVPKTADPLPILYGDGTVSTTVLSGKTPIGIVFDEENKLAVALTNVKKSGATGDETIKWNTQQYDTSLDNCTFENSSSAADTCGKDGWNTTYEMLRTSSTYFNAANAVSLYNPSGCSSDFCKSIRWILPSMGELEKIFAKKEQIQTLLSELGGTPLNTESGAYYWSSIEHSKEKAWSKSMATGERNAQSKTSLQHVRPVIYYGEPMILAPILYADGTRSKTLSTTKTPIGIVFDESKYLAVALTDVNSSGQPVASGSGGMNWYPGDCDTPLMNCCNTYVGCYTQDAMTCDVDGATNMTKLKDGCNGKANTAAMAAYNYAPTGCNKTFCQKNKWFLPSLSELNGIYKVIDNVNITISWIKNAERVYLSQSYWSSNEYWSNYAWKFSMLDGKKDYYAKNSTYFIVRPVVKYPMASLDESGGGV